MVDPTPFQVTPLPASFGALVTGLDPETLEDVPMASLYTAWLDYGLLILPGLGLDDARQLAFARRFGEIEIEMFRVSNLDEYGRLRGPDDEVVRVLDGNRFWHYDATYMPVQSKGAVFSARITPAKGGETAWADMRAGYDALDDDMKVRIAPLAAFHSLRHSQARNGVDAVGPTGYGSDAMSIDRPPLRPLVKAHPETGRLALNIGRHAFGILGLRPDESARLLDDLRDFACQPPRTWIHRWSDGDAVIWDNRCLMHRVLPWDMSEPRDMRHTRLAGDRATEFANCA